MTAAAISDPNAKVSKVWGVPLVVVLFFAGMMLPTSLSVNAGGLRLSAYRVLLILMFIPMLVQLLSGKRGKMHIFDLFVALHCFWAFLALVKWGGLGKAIETGGIYTVEFAGPYLLARLYIRSFHDYQMFAKAFVGVCIGMLAFTIPEAVTAVHILYDFFAAISGSPRAPFIEQRMGLERTFGPFDHPIL